MLNEVSLFVMAGCSVCPQMKRLFTEMQQSGMISELKIMDVTEHPKMVEEYHIRSVPFYLINGVGFNGLKTREEINQLLNQDDQANWQNMLSEELRSGELDRVEQQIRQSTAARDAMLNLLEDPQSELVVRIGLSAVIESLADSDLLLPYQSRFIQMTGSQDERIAVDAIYYLSLLASDEALVHLNEMARQGDKPGLQEHAREVLQELAADQVIH
jgi:hypothetical protein